MLARMSADEFQYWFALEQLQPFGEIGEYLRAGRIAATFANANREKNTPPFKVRDMMPEIELKPQGPRPRQTFAEMRAILRGAARQ